MSSGSYDSVNKDDDDEYGQGQSSSYQQFASQGCKKQQHQQQQQQQQQSEQHEAMTPQPSVGRFTEKEKSTSMFSRKPPIPKTSQESSSSSQSTSSGIVNLRAPSSTHAEDKMNKRKK